MRLVVAAALVAVTGWFGAGPATAGGPTSVLLSVPGEGRTAALYYSDREYVALSSLLGVESSDGSGATDPSGPDQVAGVGVTVSWLIHDVSVWRVDRVYLQAEDGPWVATRLYDWEQGALGQETWHQPERGRALATLLDGLGVGADPSGAGDGGDASTTPESGQGGGQAPAAEPAAASGPSTGGSGADSTSTGGGVALAGAALLGVALGVLVGALGACFLPGRPGSAGGVRTKEVAT